MLVAASARGVPFGGLHGTAPQLFWFGHFLIASTAQKTRGVLHASSLRPQQEDEKTRGRPRLFVE